MTTSTASASWTERSPYRSSTWEQASATSPCSRPRGFRATVLAFEPSPSTFALLQANVTRNGLPNVEPHPLAIGTRSSYWLQRARPSATASSWADPGPNRDDSIRVRGSSLDPFVPAGDVDLLKIDVEGGEIDVLESLTTSLRRRVKRLAIEYHDHIIEDSSSTVARMLRDWGLLVTVTPDRYNPAIGYVYGRSPSLGRASW